MGSEFDPYYEWLGIPPKDQPPNHYRLLGLDLFESNPKVIDSAADRNMQHVRSFQSGPRAAESQRILSALAAARFCLLHTDKRLAYDAELRRKLWPKPASPPVAAPPIAHASPPKAASPAALLATGAPPAPAPPRRPPAHASPSGSDPGGGSDIHGGIHIQTDAPSFVDRSRKRGQGSKSQKPASKDDEEDEPQAARRGISVAIVAAVAVASLIMGTMLIAVVVYLLGGKEIKVAKQELEPAPGVGSTSKIDALKAGVIPKKQSTKKPDLSDLPDIDLQEEPKPVTPAPRPVAPQPVAPVAPLSHEGLLFYAALDQDSGSEVHDLARQAKGQIVGNVRRAPGKFGQALELDGSAYVDFGDILALERTQPLTLAAWVKSTAGTTGSILGRRSPESHAGYDLLVKPTGFEANLVHTSPSNSAQCQASVKPVANQWQHVALVYDGSSKAAGLKLFVGGELVNSTVLADTLSGSILNTSTFCLGSRQGKQNFQGTIDEARVYGRALSDQEIKQLAAYEPPPEPVLAATAFEASLQQSILAARDALARGATVDLLALLPPSGGDQADIWRRTPSGLDSPGSGAAYLSLPLAPPESYVLVATLSRTAGAGPLLLSLPVGAQQTQALLLADETPSTLSSASGATLGAVANSPTAKALLGTTPVQLVCDVRPMSINIRVGNTQVIAWQGDAEQLARSGTWKGVGARALGLGSQDSQWHVEELKLGTSLDDVASAQKVRPHPPSAEQSKDLNLQLRGEYKTALRTAKTPEAKAALALEIHSRATLLESEPIPSYVLLSLALEIATEAGDLERALAIIAEMSERYEIDRWPPTMAQLTAAQREAESPLQQLQVARLSMGFIESALAAESYDAVDQLLKVVEAIGLKLKDNELKARARSRRADLRLARGAFDASQKARTALITYPEDPAAHLAIGKYLCFIRQDWKRGLPYLVRSNDTALRPLAQLEASRADSAAQLVKLGDAWLAYAPSAGEFRACAEARGIDCYFQALNQLDKAPQAALLPKVNQLLVDQPALLPPYSTVGLKLWLRADQGVQHQRGAVYQWNDSSGRGNHAVQDKPNFAPLFVLSAVNGRPVVRMQEGSGQGLRFGLPDIASYAGLTVSLVVSTGEVKRDGECVVGIPGPDVKWMFGSRNNDLGHLGAAGIGTPKCLEPGQLSLLTYRFHRRQGWTVEKNGVLAGSNVDRAFPATPHSGFIGNYQPNTTGYQPFGGDIAEILIFDHPLSAPQHAQLTKHLSLKYALCLPAPTK